MEAVGKYGQNLKRRLKSYMAKFAFRNDDEKRKQRLESLYLAAKQNQQSGTDSYRAGKEQTTPAERPSS